ncbi:zinc-binding domain-containing protein [Diaporthe sp. PMI_573]|nr:zinc-binding domain-containing protein [Diaporthaceae sp. PMI_573]
MRWCESCQRSFGNQKALKQHLQDSPVHSRLSFNCVPCEKSFVNDEALKQHLRDSQAHFLRESQPSRRDSAEIQTSFMFPELHKAVTDAVAPFMTRPRFRNNVDHTPEKEYSTYVMAKFTCNNHGRIPRIWSSKKVTIVIRSYGKKEYNAVVYNQGCEKCANLGRIILDESSYVERVSYRLKKWAGIRMEPQGYTGGVGPPHLEELCEGCRAGYCQHRRLQSVAC